MKNPAYGNLKKIDFDYEVQNCPNGRFGEDFFFDGLCIPAAEGAIASKIGMHITRNELYQNTQLIFQNILSFILY